jgi:hypothetical protein
VNDPVRVLERLGCLDGAIAVLPIVHIVAGLEEFVTVADFGD